MMFNVSACGLGELPTPSNNKIGNISGKQHQRLRTEEGDDQDKTVVGRGKRIRKNNSQSEASSSSSNKSNLNEDAVLGDKKRFITLKLTNDGHKKSRVGLPLPFMRENGLNKHREIGMLAKDGKKLMVSLLKDVNGRMSLGRGWRDFALVSDFQIGESITLELIWRDSTPMFRFSSTGTDSECDKRQGDYCSQACEEEPICIEPSGNRDKKEKNNIEDKEYSSLETPNRVLTLTLKPKDVRECNLILPSEFMRAYGIHKHGTITILGKANMKWWGYRSSRDGTIAIGIGWANFCKANGIKTGNLFTLELISEEVGTTPVFRICPNSGD
ncbi:B3 DNA binding domain [Arabidopsis thaliana x Arabidopsis arenosa]|uniref:B3 DNA binding domain n=1 Tax=Arabidopsis thaliana x Arabidopsis arenosa TaxID=1240361 RepID=A0A8T2A3V2_9BRAS|nr:B3 DNA binding domain [Arabidopsis thaliana x Arabidopsis arenosa]